MTYCHETSNVKHISFFTRDSRDLREMRDWSEVLSSRFAPVAHTTNRAYQSIGL
jgi:hypothetical protein